MSDSPKPLSDLREEYQRERLLQRTAKVRAERAIVESWFPGGIPGSFGDRVVCPQWNDVDGWQGAGYSTATPREKKGQNWPLVRTEQDLFQIQYAARLVHQTNRFAQGALRNLRNYTIKTGLTYRVEPEESKQEDGLVKLLAKAVQQFLDTFRDTNAMPTREKSGFTRDRRDGEVIVRLFDAEMPIVRFVETEQIKQPSGTGDEWTFGIEADPDDAETVMNYAVYYDPSDPEIVPASEIYHKKINVDECVKRGLSDFFSVGDAFEDVKKLVRNMTVGASIQAAVVGLRQHQTGQDGVERMRTAARAAVDRVSPITNKAINYQHYAPGTILDAPAGMQYAGLPWMSSGAPNHIAVSQSALRSIGQRWCMPEYMISGDASNANYASTLVAGSPFVISVETEQDEYKTYLLAVHWGAVRLAADRGLFELGGRTVGYDEIQAALCIKCEAPTVAIADKLADAQRKEILLRNRITSAQRWRGEEGYISDEIKQELATEPPPQPQPTPQPQQQPFSLKLEGLQMPPQDPTPFVEALRGLTPQGSNLTVLQMPTPAAPVAQAEPLPPVITRREFVRDERGLVVGENVIQEDAKTILAAKEIADHVRTLLEEKPDGR